MITAKSAMHVDVSEILNKGEGEQATFEIADESPVLEGITLAAPLSGEIRVVGTKTGVIVGGRLSAEITLECDRCLRAFDHHLDVPIKAEFEDHPNEDQFPIDKYGKVDLAEPVRQEIEVHTPLQKLCQEDCSGIELKQKKDSNGSS